MKSSRDDLKKRGYIEDIDTYGYSHLSYKELCALIHSQKAYERTIAVRLLGSNALFETGADDILLGLLVKEKSLYTKIEICSALENCGTRTAKKMMELLGKIGNNQYSSLPQRVSKKSSYPLPRDIIARILGKMKIEVLPVMLDFPPIGGVPAIREIIDAIGYMCFYNDIADEKLAAEKLKECFEIYQWDAVIRWKVVTAFSSFHHEEAICWLEGVKANDKEALVREEAKRSLGLVKRRI
jgi:hypothetical protein